MALRKEHRALRQFIILFTFSVEWTNTKDLNSFAPFILPDMMSCFSFCYRLLGSKVRPCVIEAMFRVSRARYFLTCLC